MKIITIGDLHGSTAWKKILADEWDRLIFIGDYTDSFDYTDDHILHNLLEVIDFKKKYPEKVSLLLGNHDLGYYYNGTSRHGCSGFRRKMLAVLNRVFQTEKENFQVSFQSGKYLWTHAGVVQRWYDHFIKSQLLPTDENLAFTFNRLFLSYHLPMFHVSEIRGGYEKDGGIFWADSLETSTDPLPGHHQIVGHTKTGKGIVSLKSQVPDTSITYVDCLESKTEFLELDL